MTESDEGGENDRNWDERSSRTCAAITVSAYLAGMPLLLILLFLSLSYPLAAGQSGQAPQALPALAEETPGEEELRIYAAVIDDLLLKNATGCINISDKTWHPDFLVGLLSTHPPFSDEPGRLEPGVLESFRERNDREYPLERRFNLSVPYSMVDERSEPVATGIAGFSRVGLSPDSHQALLLLDWAAYWYVSEGTFVLLEKEDGVWKVKATELAYLGE